MASPELGVKTWQPVEGVLLSSADTLVSLDLMSAVYPHRHNDQFKEDVIRFKVLEERKTAEVPRSDVVQMTRSESRYG